MIEALYALVGLVLAIVAAHTFADTAHPRRWTSGAFWLLFALTFLLGGRVPPQAIGVAVIAMALLAGFGGVRGGAHASGDAEARRASAVRLGNRIFLPALAISVVTLVYALLVPGGAFVGLGIGCIVAWLAALLVTRDTPLQSMREARRLIDALGWAAVLPQMLAMLGLVFTAAGVGKAVAAVATAYVDVNSLVVGVLVFALGMALFTIVMGNAFAAFPIMVGGIGVPVLVGVHHADPAVVAAIGMFSGYCGTLVTPMAANFNLVPVALLELEDRYAVIKAQAMTALPLLVCNIILLLVLVHR